MDFAEIKELYRIGVQRTDLADFDNLFINTAIRDIEDARSFKCMKTEVELTILNGTSSVELPADYKELQNENSPIQVVLTDGGLKPVEVVTDEQERRRIFALGGFITNDFRVILDETDDSAFLRIAGEADGDIVLRVRYYRYLPDLSADADENFFTVSDPLTVVLKAKQLAFESVNDPAALDAEAAFNKRFLGACVQESYSQVKGRTLHM